MPLTPGTRLGPYEIVAQLGQGGMGMVFRARDTKLEREVAVKVLPRNLAEDPDALGRFEREAKAVAALSHPNILAIHDFGREEGTVYAAMELLEGETLRQRLQDGALPTRKAVEIALEIARGLAAAHEKGIVHRDLKPENVFLLGSGQVKVLDFGLARMDPVAPEGSDVPTMSLSTEPGRVMGTVGYMAPEQVRGKAVDARADIFSFGAVLYEMLTGKRAFRGESPVETLNAILKEDPPSLFESTRNVSPALERIVRRCLEKRPEERFRSAHDLAIALDAISTSSTRSLTTEALEPSGEPPRRSRPSPRAARPGPGRRRPGRGRDAGLVARAPDGGERRRGVPLDELLRPRLLARGVAGRPHRGVHLRPRRPAPDLAEAGERRGRGPAHDRPRRLSAVLAGRDADPLRPARRGGHLALPRGGARGRGAPAARGRDRGGLVARREADRLCAPAERRRPDGECGRAWRRRTARSRARSRRCRAGCARPAWRPTGARSRSCRRRGRCSPARSRAPCWWASRTARCARARARPAPQHLRRGVDRGGRDRLPAGRVGGQRGGEHGHPRAAGRGERPRRLADLEPVERARPRRAGRRARRLRHALAAPEPARGDALVRGGGRAAGSRAASPPTASRCTRPTASGWPSRPTAAAG